MTTHKKLKTHLDVKVPESVVKAHISYLTIVEDLEPPRKTARFDKATAVTTHDYRPTSD